MGGTGWGALLPAFLMPYSFSAPLTLSASGGWGKDETGAPRGGEMADVIQPCQRSNMPGWWLAIHMG